MRIAAAATSALVLVLCGCGAEREQLRADRPGDVYRVVLEARGSSAVERVAPASGHWRQEAGGRTAIHVGTGHAVVDEHGASVRKGSRAFVGVQARNVVSLEPLRRQLASGDGSRDFAILRNGIELTAKIAEVISPEEAGERKLFALPTERVRSLTVERRVGEPPSHPTRAYWFGPSLRGLRASQAIEHTDESFAGRPASRTYTVLYGPGETLQVSSQPVGQELARRTIAAFDGRNGDATYPPWPRTEITLADGERAVAVPNLGEGNRPVIGFSVITATTLVSVTGSYSPEEIPELASRLVPVGSQ